MRQIILDTETTGLSAEAGDRIIEIGCARNLDEWTEDLGFVLFKPKTIDFYDSRSEEISLTIERSCFEQETTALGERLLRAQDFIARVVGNQRAHECRHAVIGGGDHQI